MAKVRQLLKHVTVDIAKRGRRCHRNRAHRIEPGAPCLVVRDDGGPHRRNYCLDCAAAILKLCADDLRELGGLLYPDRFPQRSADPPAAPTKAPPPVAIITERLARDHAAHHAQCSLPFAEFRTTPFEVAGANAGQTHATIASAE